MTKEKAIAMIDDCLLEPNSMSKDWIDVFKLCKESLEKYTMAKSVVEKVKSFPIGKDKETDRRYYLVDVVAFNNYTKEM